MDTSKTQVVEVLQTAASTPPNPKDVRRDGPLLETAGGEIEYAVPLVRRIQDSPAIEVAALTGDYAGGMHYVLDGYAAWIEDGGKVLNPLGFSAQLECGKAAK